MFEVETQKIDFGVGKIGPEESAHILSLYSACAVGVRLGQEDAFSASICMVTTTARVELLQHLSKTIAEFVCAKFKRSNGMDELCDRIAYEVFSPSWVTSRITERLS
ncbi:hypothetical protein ACNJYA_02775 [Bradyrhizobium sp. DASA03068]|uniref:hypothetical protein n=1 Tax=Bradyrhizobium sp. BLXBL-01 TaxID=3395915 RepID=UPI003F729871